MWGVLVAGAVLLLVAGAGGQAGPPPTTAAVRNLIESFIGTGTVTRVSLHAAGREVEVHVRMDGVRSLPADRVDWGWFFRDVSEIATSRVFRPPLRHQGLERLTRIHLWYSLGGRVVARAARDRGQVAPTVVLIP